MIAVAAVLCALASNALLFARVRHLDHCRRVLARQLINTENKVLQLNVRLAAVEIDTSRFA